jgi:hypothetical protein
VGRRLKRRLGAWVGGQETRDVGASTVGCAGKGLRKRRWLMGGVHRTARENSRTGGQR